MAEGPVQNSPTEQSLLTPSAAWERVERQEGGRSAAAAFAGTRYHSKPRAGSRGHHIFDGED